MIRNVVLISPDFPSTYYQFAKAFKKNGCVVLAIGSTPVHELHPELLPNVNEYYQTYEMENTDRMCDILNYFVNKYGPIDFLESNNEYWLQHDAILRERFGIRSGLYPAELREYQRKSSMKKAFLEAGAHVAPFLLVNDLDELKEFAKKYGYPLFAKPDIGVGAAGNYKIDDEEGLLRFYNEKPQGVLYICEAFVQGQIVTFDGVADANSEVVFCVNEVFPREIYKLHITGDEMCYHVNKEVPENILELGKKIIKAFALKNRFFHTELFIAENSIPGCFKEGDIVPIEINIRTPGGFTPDLLDFSLSASVYQIFADVICFGSSNVPIGPRYYAMCASRRDRHQYFFTHEDILRTFKNQLCVQGRYPQVLADLMGDQYYMAKFENLEDAIIFSKYVMRRANQTYPSSHDAINHVGGEDKRMLDDRKQENSASDLTICDKHIDGA